MVDSGDHTRQSDNPTVRSVCQSIVELVACPIIYVFIANNIDINPYLHNEKYNNYEGDVRGLFDLDVLLVLLSSGKYRIFVSNDILRKVSLRFYLIFIKPKVSRHKMFIKSPLEGDTKV